jgi:RNA polymerase sigma factor (sigma-70 family)
MTIIERNQLVLNYMPLANKIASEKNKKTPKNITLDELRSAAYLGLIQAANRFNKESNCSFATYAKYRITGEIKDYLRKNKIKFVEIQDQYYYNIENQDNIDLFSTIYAIIDTTGRSIIKMYYVDNKSMKQIGKQLNITESRVSQMICKYKKIIRKKIS